MYLNVCRYFK